jgi:hypothetical protein
MKFISKRMWYIKTSPYQPSHVTNYFRIKRRLCHLGFNRAIGIPFVQQVVSWESMNKLHGTSSNLAFLNQLSPFNESHFSFLMKSSFNSNCISLILALKPSKVCAKDFATCRLYPSKFLRNTSHP